MGRKIIAVIVGFVAWTVLWLGGNQLLLADEAAAMGKGEALTSPGPLAIALALSVVCSLAAGVSVGLLVRAGPAKPALILGIILLLVGIGVQASAWKLMPVWYHATFLVLLLPATMLGARLVPRRAA